MTKTAICFDKLKSSIRTIVAVPFKDTKVRYTRSRVDRSVVTRFVTQCHNLWSLGTRKLD